MNTKGNLLSKYQNSREYGCVFVKNDKRGKKFAGRNRQDIKVDESIVCREDFGGLGRGKEENLEPELGFSCELLQGTSDENKRKEVALIAGKI
jgi:hypothetical protein